MRSSVLVLAVVAVLALLCFAAPAAADRAAAQAKVAKYNTRVGAKYIAEKAKEEGVKALPSGVHYKVITEGEGDKPTTKDTVKVHYAGTLITGTEFDSSYSRGQPAEFPVTGVIAGWTEILQHMTVGSVYEVYIPSDKAYGASGSGAKIGPNATLVFKIELLEIKGKKAPSKKAKAAKSEL